MKTPEILYLTDEDSNFEAETYWCEDKVGENDVKYICADLVPTTNADPYGWLIQGKNDERWIIRSQALKKFYESKNANLLPLYTTPQTKPLSVEEIEVCYWGDGYPDNPRSPVEFARAIEERILGK